MNELL